MVSGGKDQVLDLLRTLVETLVNQKVADGANSLFDLIKFAYGDHLHGDETCPAWVETATAQIKLTGDDSQGAPVADGSLTSLLRATINDEVILDKLGALLTKIEISLKDLLVKEKGNIAIDIALGAIKDLGAIFSKVGGKTPGNMIPNIPELAELAHGALYSLTHDENQLGDRVNTLATGLVDPDWKPGGGSGNGSGGSTGGSGNGNGTGSGNGNGGSAGGGSGSGNGGSNDNGFGTGNGSTSGNGGSAGAITGSSKSSSGKLPQTDDTNTFAAAALMGLGALAAAIHTGSRNEALDTQDTEEL